MMRTVILLAVWDAAASQTQNCQMMPELCVRGVTGQLGNFNDCGQSGPMGADCCGK